MKRGPKPELANTKAQRGTLRRDRDGDVVVQPVSLIAAGDPPIMPDYLQPAAREIWMEELSRVMLAGVTERDSSLFAAYCSVEALNRAAFIAGEAPPSAHPPDQRRPPEFLRPPWPPLPPGTTADG